MEISIEEMARIIADRELPLSLKMTPPEEYEEGIRKAIEARDDAQYSGLSYTEVLAKLRANLTEASSGL